MLILFLVSQTWPVTLSKQEKVFSSSTVSPNSKGAKLGSSDQESPSSAGKITGVLLAPCLAWWYGLTAIFGGVNIPKVPGCHLLR